MKQLLGTTLLTFIVLGTANAGDRYSDLTKEYLYGENSTVSVSVRRVIAKENQTAQSTLKLLLNDTDKVVRKKKKKNIASKS